MSLENISPTVLEPNVSTVSQSQDSYNLIPEYLQDNHTSNVTPRKNSSASWKYFDRISKLMACCKLCGIQVPIKHGSTAGLFSHLKNKHPANYQAVKVDTYTSTVYKPKIVNSDYSHLLIPETYIKQEESIMTSLITSKPRDSILEYIAGCRSKDNSFTDVVIHCKDGQVRAHKIVLASVSEYLKYLFMSSEHEEENILLADFSCQVISDFLNDLYTGQNFLKYEAIVSSLLILKPFAIQDMNWKKQILNKKGFNNFYTNDNDDHDEFGVKLEASGDNETEHNPLDKRPKNLQEILGTVKLIENSYEDSSSLIDGLKSVEAVFKTPKVKGTKKKRSQVWQHFTKDEGDCSTCCCHHCGRHIASHGGSTSAMMKHLVINHPEVLDLKEIPEKYKLIPPVQMDSKLGITKQIFVTAINDTSKCAVCEKELTTKNLAGLHQHMSDEHNEIWIKEGMEMRVMVRERSERVELCFMMGEIENNMVCRLCQTIVNRSEMEDHLKGEHREYQPTLSIYFNVEEEGLVKCDLCGVGSLDINDIDSHMEGNHPDMCGTIRLLRQVLRSDTEEMTVEERVALESFAKHLNLGEVEAGKSLPAIDTKFKVKDDLPYKVSADGKTCGDCGKVYVSKSSCRLHWRAVHSGLRPFECEKCGNTFTRKDSYDSHMTMHENSQPFMCSECGKTFNRRHARDQHERAHRGDFRFACSFCGRKFLSGQQMRGHERTHTGEKPFQCSQCGRQFVQKHQLVTHFRTHTGEKPYQCTKCKQWFKHLSSRRNHKCEPVEPVLLEGRDEGMDVSERHRLDMMEKMKQHFSAAAGVSRDITDMRLTTFHHPDFK